MMRLRDEATGALSALDASPTAPRWAKEAPPPGLPPWLRLKHENALRAGWFFARATCEGAAARFGDDALREGARAYARAMGQQDAAMLVDAVSGAAKAMLGDLDVIEALTDAGNLRSTEQVACLWLERRDDHDSILALLALRDHTDGLVALCDRLRFVDGLTRSAHTTWTALQGRVRSRQLEHVARVLGAPWWAPLLAPAGSW